MTPIVELTDDTCDRCNAPVTHFAALEHPPNSREGSLVLGFCDHHTKQYRSALEQKDWLIVQIERKIE